MANWHQYVYSIFHDIQAMPNRERRKLWDLLRHAYPNALEDTDPTPLEVWDDLRNRCQRPSTVRPFDIRQGNRTARGSARSRPDTCRRSSAAAVGRPRTTLLQPRSHRPLRRP